MLRRVVRWLAGIGAVLIGLAVIVTVPFAALDALLVSTQSDCPLGMQFERTGAETVARRTFPPRVECRYEYELSDGTELFPPSNQVYDSTLSVLVALTSVTVAVMVVVTVTIVRNRRPRVALAGGAPDR